MTDNIDGIWTVEVYGPFGWESLGILVLEEGRIMGGGNRHYSSGNYRCTGNQLTATVEVHYYGPPRAMFGESVERFTSKLVMTVKDGVAEGDYSRPDKKHLNLQARLTRRMDIPERTP